MISFGFPSPGHQSTMFGGGSTHPACDGEPRRVAVAVTAVSPVVNGKVNGPNVAMQFAFVVTSVEPRKFFPWPKPDEWHAGLEKNSRRKAELATLLKVPDIITLPPLNVAEVMTG